MIDTESLDIAVAGDTTDEQVDALDCELLIPHGARDDNTAVHTVDGTRDFGLPACP